MISVVESFLQRSKAFTTEGTEETQRRAIIDELLRFFSVYLREMVWLYSEKFLKSLRSPARSAVKVFCSKVTNVIGLAVWLQPLCQPHFDNGLACDPQAPGFPVK